MIETNFVNLYIDRTLNGNLYPTQNSISTVFSLNHIFFCLNLKFQNVKWQFISHTEIVYPQYLA
jgi:hypothetical protein